MSIFYFNGAVDQEYTTLGNWWSDASCTIPAGSLPTTADSIIVDPVANIAIGSNLGDSPTVVNIETNIDLYIDCTVTGTITLNASAVLVGNVTGNAIFNDASVCSFEGSGSVTGDATFNGTSSNFGLVTGNVVFNDDSINRNTVSGNATFNDNSSNCGYVLYDAVFNGLSSNGSAIQYSFGEVQGNAEFRDSSINEDGCGSVWGNADVYYPVVRPLTGTVSGATTYIGYEKTLYFYTALWDGEYTNLDNWWTDALHTIQATELPGASDSVIAESAIISNSGDEPVLANFETTSTTEINMTVTGAAIYNGVGAQLWSGLLTGNAIFNDAVLTGSILGGAEFHGVAANLSGTISGMGVFCDFSYNSGEIGGDGLFYAESYNIGIVMSNASFFALVGIDAAVVDITSYGSGSVLGTLLDANEVGISTWIFNNTSLSDAGVVACDAIFNNASCNSGSVSGQATFNDVSYNYGNVGGQITFNSLLSLQYSYEALFNASVTVNVSSGSDILGTGLL